MASGVLAKLHGLVVIQMVGGLEPAGEHVARPDLAYFFGLVQHLNVEFFGQAAILLFNGVAGAPPGKVLICPRNSLAMDSSSMTALLLG